MFYNIFWIFELLLDGALSKGVLSRRLSEGLFSFFTLLALFREEMEKIYPPEPDLARAGRE